MIRRVVCEIDVPEDIESNFSFDPSGVYFFERYVIQWINSMDNTFLKPAINKFNSLSSGCKTVANKKQAEMNLRTSLKVVGYLDEQNNFQTDF